MDPTFEKDLENGSSSSRPSSFLDKVEFNANKVEDRLNSCSKCMVEPISQLAEPVQPLKVIKVAGTNLLNSTALLPS